MNNPLRRLFPLAWTTLAVAALALLAPATAFAAPAADVAGPEKAAKDAPAKDAAGKDGAKDADSFLRFVDDGKGGGRLEAAIVTYKNADGVKVHLVSAVHLGDKAYYDGLSKTFEEYDALLYELVKPKGAGAPPPPELRGGPSSGIGAIQEWLGSLLELQFQLDAIDYSKANFVHADLDAETFTKMQEERGESMFTLMWQAMQVEMQRQLAGEGGEQVGFFDILVALSSPDSARQLKLLLARQFENMEQQMAAMEGEGGSVLLTERNKAAVKVLKEQVAAGKKNLGIFYGAGHMVGIESMLVKDMGFERDGTDWRVAWDMTAPPPAEGDAEGEAEGKAGAAEKKDQPGGAKDDASEVGDDADARSAPEPEAAEVGAGSR